MLNRSTCIKPVCLLFIALLMGALAPPAQALLGGFETADGYNFAFARDNWSYDAGQTGTSFLPAQYNTGRWKELLGSSVVGDSQYVSQHGVGSGGAFSAPFALAVRALSPTSPGSHDMTVSYDVGADDTGLAPTTPLTSATIDFDICPGLTVIPGVGIESNFNNVNAFSLSFGGTDASPGVTVGFTDQDPGNANTPRLTYYNGGTYSTMVVPWSLTRFDHMQVLMNFNTQTYDLYWTRDFIASTNQFDPGNAPVLVVAGAAFSNPIGTLEQMYFRTHTDPGDGISVGGLEKSYLDNFSFNAVPEPASLSLLAMGAMALVRRRYPPSRS